MAFINETLLRMTAAWSGLKARMADEHGQDLLEYALLGGLLAAAITAAGVVLLMTGAINGMAAGIKDCIDFDSSTSCGPF